MLDSGKYGTVMKGLLHDEEVAVKMFPEAHQQYFINERNIYSLPLMECPALLQYFGKILLRYNPIQIITIFLIIISTFL